MYHDQVILGEWEEVSRLHGPELIGHRVEIRVIDHKDLAKPSRMIREGMFPELIALTDEDFRAAEWHAIGLDNF
jgi:hypothetical protein